MCFCAGTLAEETIEKQARNHAYRLPKKVLYWAVVRAAAIAEPNLFPGDKTATEMLEAIEKEE